MIYVDNLRTIRETITPCCMLFADDPGELIQFASKVGLDPRLIELSKIPHFKVDGKVRAHLIRLGVQPLSNKEMLRKINEIASNKKQLITG